MADEHEPEFWPCDRPFSEDDLRETMSGHAPEWLQENCRRMIEFALGSGAVDYVGMREAQQHRARSPRKKG